MKILFILLSLLTPFTSVFASDLSEYEQHYEELNRLRGELEKLELEKKIQEIKASIKATRIGSARATAAQAAAQAAAESEAQANISGNPATATLMYIIGTGVDTKAVIDFLGILKTVKNGEVVDGWKVKIEGRKVHMEKGNDSVEL